MTVFVLLTDNGTVHSVWDSPKELLAQLDRFDPPGLNEETWQVVSVEPNRWMNPRHDSVDYVRSVLESGVSDRD